MKILSNIDPEVTISSMSPRDRDLNVRVRGESGAEIRKDKVQEWWSGAEIRKDKVQEW